MKKSYIIIGVVVVVMLAAIGIYAVINSNSQSKKQLEENSTNIEGTTNTENSAKENKDENIQNNQISNESEENNMYSTGKHHAEIVVKNYGTIALELDSDVAPITVENFAWNAKKIRPKRGVSLGRMGEFFIQLLLILLSFLAYLRLIPYF